MLNTNSPTPLYEQIKEYILHKINSGELVAHTRIPSERNLSQQFGVSRLTAAKAIKELVLEGKLYTKVGKGTFVNDDTFNQTLGSLTSFTEEMVTRGQRPTSRVLRTKVVEANEKVARRLNVAVGTSIFVLERVRMANDQPIAVEVSSIIASYCGGILAKHDFSQESLYSVLREDYNLHLTHAEQVFEARGASQEEADILVLTVGSPILHITRVTYMDENRPLEFVQSAYRGDRYKFRAILRKL